MNMQSIRSFLLTAAGIAFTMMALVFTASLGVALAGIVAVLMAASALSARFSPKPVRATARAQGPRPQKEPRIWNDGRGTIIDL